jgi:hypothetical protein
LSCNCGDTCQNCKPQDIEVVIDDRFMERIITVGVEREQERIITLIGESLPESTASFLIAKIKGEYK